MSKFSFAIEQIEDGWIIEVPKLKNITWVSIKKYAKNTHDVIRTLTEVFSYLTEGNHLDE